MQTNILICVDRESLGILNYILPKFFVVYNKQWNYPLQEFSNFDPCGSWTLIKPKKFEQRRSFLIHSQCCDMLVLENISLLPKLKRLRSTAQHILQVNGKNIQLFKFISSVLDFALEGSLECQMKL